MAVCAEVTAATVAVKVAVVALVAIVIEAGTVTAELLLERFTLRPPAGAGADKVTLQESLPAPVIELLLQEMPVSAGGALSCSANVEVEPFAVAVRVAVSEEVIDDTVAAKLALVAFAGTVTDAGTVTEALLLASPTGKPPVGAAAERVTVQLSVPALVIVLTLQERLLRAATGLSCTAKEPEAPFALAVTVAVCTDVTALTFAVKLAVVAFAATVTVDGTTTAELSLATPTLNPPVGAGPESVTVQASAPAPVYEALLQTSALTVRVAAVPVPLRLTTVVLPVDELLEIVS